MADTQPLDVLQPRAKSAAEYNAETIAASPNSSEILQNLQRRAAELSSPWRALQGNLDEMVARTAYHPETGVTMLGEKRAKEAQELQNIGMLTAQSDMYRKQLSGIRSGFQQTESAPQNGTQAQGDDKQHSGYTFKGVPLTNFEYQTLSNYVNPDGSFNDISGFNAAFKAISDIHSRAKAEYKGYDVVDTIVSGYDLNGVYTNFPTKISVRDLQNWEENKIVPPMLKGRIQDPKIQPIEKKAMGGSVRYMADGAQPENAPMSPMPAPTALAPMNQPSASMEPQAAPRGSMAEDIISLLTSSGNAQAAPTERQGSVSVSAAPKVDYSLSPDFAKQVQQSQLQQQEQTNQAELKSTEEERTEAGKFVGKISTLASSFDEIQRRAGAIIDHASKHPGEFAYKQQTGPYSYMLEAVGAVPWAGEPVEKALEGIKAKIGGQDVINRRSETQGHADSLGIEYTQEKFAGSGARIGQGLTQIAQNAKNIGTDKPAQVNLVNSYMIYATAGKFKDLAAAWQKYKAENPKNPDPFKFQDSLYFKNVENKWAIYLDEKLNALHTGVPPDGTVDKDKNGKPFVWKNGKPMREIK